jgi:hypothetical protein
LLRHDLARDHQLDLQRVRVMRPDLCDEILERGGSAAWRAAHQLVANDGTRTMRARAGWTKVKDRSCSEREAWQFDRR